MCVITSYKLVPELQLYILIRDKYIALLLLLLLDGSCIAQIFPSRKLNALTHNIHANINTDINIIHTHTHTHTPRAAYICGNAC